MLKKKKRKNKMLNKIQKTIFDEYKTNGRVWAECPRQAGKTELLVKIAIEELCGDNKVFVKTFSTDNYMRIINIIKIKIGRNSKKIRNIVRDEESADVVLYDEVYYDYLLKPKDVKVACLRTPQHKTLRFNYLDLEEDKIDRALDLTRCMSKKQWDIEFNNGVKKCI